MEADGSFPCPQQPTTSPYPAPHEYSPCPPILFLSGCPVVSFFQVTPSEEDQGTVP